MAVLEAKLVITADDKTGSAFKAIEEHVARISAMSKEIGRLSGSAAGLSGGASLAAEFERAERAASHFATSVKAASETVSQIARGFDNVATHAARAQEKVSLLSRAAHSAKHAVKEISPLVMGGAGFGILETTKEFTKAGAEIQSERAKMGVAGIPINEIASADSQSADLAAKYTNVSRHSILESYREARSVLLDPKETPGMMDSIIAARSAMQAANPQGGEHASEGLGYAIKGAEILGVAQNPERFHKYLDSFVKAQQVMGKTISPEQQYQFAQMVRSSGITLSDRFKMTTGVSLSQELKGGQTGQAIDQFTKQIIGGFQGNNHAAAKEFVALGLADKSDFETTKTGEIKGMKHGRKVAGADLAQTDPDTWVYQHLLPALEKHGYKTTNDQIGEIRRLFPAGRASDLVAKLITQRESYQNHAKLYGEATGLDGAQKLVKEDPNAALNALGTSLTNFGAAVTQPIMKDAAAALSSMASTIGAWGASLSAWQKDHPDLSKMLAGGAIAGGLSGGGALGYGAISALTSGFGLKGAAADLTTAAEALKGAAAQGHGGLSEVGGKPGSPGYVPLGGRGALAAFQIYDLARNAPGPDDHGVIHPPLAPFVKALDDWGAKNLPKAGAPSLSGSWSQGLFHAAPSGYGRDYTLGSNGGFQTGGKSVPPGGFAYGSNYDWTHNTGRSPLGVDAGALSAGLASLKATVEGPITAELTGAADVNVHVTVTPSGDLIKAAATASASTKGNLKANVGTSLPEAGAGSSGANGTAKQ